MNSKENFYEMVAYDFSNLNVGQQGNDNCFTCDAGGCNCDSGDCDGCDYCDGPR